MGRLLNESAMGAHCPLPKLWAEALYPAKKSSPQMYARRAVYVVLMSHSTAQASSTGRSGFLLSQNRNGRTGSRQLLYPRPTDRGRYPRPRRSYRPRREYTRWRIGARAMVLGETKSLKEIWLTSDARKQEAPHLDRARNLCLVLRLLGSSLSHAPVNIATR